VIPSETYPGLLRSVSKEEAELRERENLAELQGKRSEAKRIARRLARLRGERELGRWAVERKA